MILDLIAYIVSWFGDDPHVMHITMRWLGFDTTQDRVRDAIMTYARHRVEYK